MNRETTLTKIEYHADDYGLFPKQSKRILDCHIQGKLNGVSIFPNSNHLTDSMASLRPFLPDIAITVHLNFIEGRCMSSPKRGLTDDDGTLRLSFSTMLLRSFLPRQKKVRAWLKEEIRCQIHSVAPYFPDGMSLRLDGHAHYHMLPLVFDALMEVIQEDQLNVSYIRIPQEHPLLYLRHLNKIKDFSPINVVKVLILNILANRNQRKYHAYLSTLEQRLFLGVFLSGRMYHENVALILPDAIALAQKTNRDIEILAHPGGVYESQDIAHITCREDADFLTSPMRKKEATLYYN